MRCTKLLLILVMLIVQYPLTAQTWKDSSLLLDKILNRYPDSIPLGQLAISRNGVVIYSAAKGVANLEYKVPLTKNSKIEAGSVSKQFIAAGVLLLQQMGNLSLQDDIRKYIPELPDYGYIITIAHLLHHTSGIKDWIPLQYLTGWYSSTRVLNNSDVLELICRQKSLNNLPGTEYIYSNSNYCLLALIIERCSKMTVNAFSRKYIFIPAGMEHSEWRHDYRSIVVDRATGYSKRGDVYFMDMPNENVYGHAGLLTTAEDLLRWNNYYLSGKLGKPSLLAAQLDAGKLNNGNINTYAAGLRIDSVDGWLCISHRGLIAGFRASIEYFPQLQLSIAWISNNSQSDLSNMQPGAYNIPSAVRALMIKDISTSTLLKTDSSIASTDFKPVMGAYRDVGSGAGLKLLINQNKIVNEPNGMVLKPIDKTTLTMGQRRLLFISTNPRKALAISPAGDTTAYAGTDTAKLDAGNASEYSGTYVSEELRATAIITKEQSGLMILFTPHVASVLVPIYKDGFQFRIENGSVAPSFSLYFERDAKNNITGFIANEPRARKLKFQKTPGAGNRE